MKNRQFSFAEHSGILGRPTDTKNYMIPKNPIIDRVGLQGDAMTVAVCTDNERVDEDIKLFSQALSNDDELIGERLRTLSRILKDMGY